MGIKELTIGLIERTEDPTAPLKVQALADALATVGPMLASLTTADKVAAINERLLAQFPDEELNVLACDPAFLMALLGNVRVALKSFVHGPNPVEP